MNNRIISMILALLVCFCALVSCSDTGNTLPGSNNGGSTDINVGGGSGLGVTPQGPGSNPDTSYADGSELTDPDVLALSYNRLEQADLSFNFSIDKGSSTQKNFADAGTSATSAGNAHVLTPGDVYYVPNEDYFEQNTDSLDAMSESAREIADFAIRLITVMDVFVVSSDLHVKMSYDEENDVVRVTTYKYLGEGMNYAGTRAEYREICIYYDEDGDETVDMWEYTVEEISTSHTVTNSCHIIYSKDKTYYIATSHTDSLYGVNQYSLQSARKTDEGWRGFSTSFEPDNNLITKDGTYDYANGLLYVNFLIEVGDSICAYSQRIVPARDGYELGSGIEALPTDDLLMQPTYIEAEGIAVESLNGFVSFSFADVIGWDRFEAYFTELQEEEYRQNGGQFYQGADDTLYLSDGTALPSYCGWSKEYGFIYPESEGMDLNWWVNGVLVPHEELDWSKIVRFIGVRAFYDPILDKFTEGVFNISLMNDSSETSLDVVADFFEEHGLTFADEISPSVISDMAKLSKRSEEYTSGLFSTLFGIELNGENYISLCVALDDEMTAFCRELEEKCDSAESVKLEDIPKRPADMDLISLKDGLSGVGSLTPNGFDLTALTFNVPKSVILSAGKEYGVCVGFSSPEGTVFVDAFTAATYAHASMTLTGKSVAIPDATKGEYTLKCFFGRQYDGGWIRLSEISNLPIANFEPFDLVRTTDEGEFTYVFTELDGEIRLSVAFTDTVAPSIGLRTESTDGTAPAELVMTEGAMSDELIASVYAKDTHDGAIMLTLGNLSRNGAPLYSGVALASGDVITVTVSDAAGNTAALTFTVRLVPESVGGDVTIDTAR